MASNPFLREQREHDRLLNRLERKYDKSCDHVREFNTDKQDIDRLRQAGVIDRDHADLLLAAAHQRYSEASKAKTAARTEERNKAREKKYEDAVRPFVYALCAAFLVWLFLF